MNGRVLISEEPLEVTPISVGRPALSFVRWLAQGR